MVVNQILDAIHEHLQVGWQHIQPHVTKLAAHYNENVAPILDTHFATAAQQYQIHVAPAVDNFVVSMKPLFQNPDTLGAPMWKPTGDWYADMFSAWDAARFKGLISQANATHMYIDSTLHGETYRSYYQTTYQYIPELKPLYCDHCIPNESRFDGTPLSHYMREYYQIPIYASMIYLVSLVVLQTIMAILPPLPIKTLQFLWNLSLSAFSTMGVIRIVPHLYALLKNHGVYEVTCGPISIYGFSESGLWTFLFIISKFPELIDTWFLIWRKRPVIFLQWYHHFTVLLYCWQSYATQSTAGIFFVAMNYSVHSIMYFYFALMTVRLWPRWFPSWIITILQLSQMVVGVGICVATYYYRNILGKTCSTTETTFMSGAIMYFTYFVLFLQLLISHTCSSKGKAQPQRGGKAKTE